MRVLLIESDPTTAKSIKLMLSHVGFNVYCTDLAEEGEDLVKLYDYDIVLSEIRIPDDDGLELLRRVRLAKVTTPWIVISAQDDTESKIKAFGFGGDDFISKPFHREELVARIHAIIRRHRGHSMSIIKTGNVEVNLDAKTVEVRGKPVHLTGKEYQMLEILSLRKGTTLTKEMFLNHLYGGMDEPELKIIDVFICKLRKKISQADDGINHIETVWGRGYVLRDPKIVEEENSMRIFVTGGAGYIGSHVVMDCALSGHEVLVYDDLSNCPEDSFTLLGSMVDSVEFVKGDILNYGGLTKAIRNFRPDVVIHLAAKKYVYESASQADTYYQTNVVGTMNVLRSMVHNDVGRMVFSSSAAVYGTPAFRKVSEDHPTSPESVYGRTKLMCEQLIHDYHQCYGILAACLRYFNPIGSHPDFPESKPKSLLSVMMRVASGEQDHLEVFGDGTAVRDFIHVADVADAHLHVTSALGYQVFNIGTGEGTKVNDLRRMVEVEIGRMLPRIYSPKRPGDIDVSVADVSLIKSRTGWQATRSVQEAVRDAWKAETTRLSIEP